MRALSGSSTDLTAMADIAADRQQGGAVQKEAGQGNEEDIEAAVRRMRTMDAVVKMSIVCICLFFCLYFCLCL